MRARWAVGDAMRPAVDHVIMAPMRLVQARSAAGASDLAAEPAQRASSAARSGAAGEARAASSRLLGGVERPARRGARAAWRPPAPARRRRTGPCTMRSRPPRPRPGTGSPAPGSRRPDAGSGPPPGRRPAAPAPPPPPPRGLTSFTGSVRARQGLADDLAPARLQPVRALAEPLVQRLDQPVRARPAAGGGAPGGRVRLARQDARGLLGEGRGRGMAAMYSRRAAA